ncbi:MAG: ECF transporter S component [Clostridia bacterium]|nr:ECF transporter S component [Clostridia bacterium]
MKRIKIQKLVLSAFFAALICVATAVFTIPLPSAYFNLGDCFILIAAFCMGSLWGGAAAAIGAGIADLVLGFAVYAPATFVIKWLMVLVAVALKKLLDKFKLHRFLSVAISALAAELCMVAGYFLFEIFLLEFKVALMDIIGNSMQGAISLIAGTLCYNLLDSTGLTKKLFFRDEQ